VRYETNSGDKSKVMIRKLFCNFVLVLLLSNCHKETQTEKNCFMIKISDALPIQFWLNGVPSFNQKTVAGIDEVCFKQNFNCEDELHLQFTDTDTAKNYKLRVTKQDGSNVEYNFTKEILTKVIATKGLQFPNPTLNVGILNWDNYNPGGSFAAFNWVDQGGGLSGARVNNGSVTASTYFGSNSLRPDSAYWPSGNYTVRVKALNNSLVSGGFSDVTVSLFGHDNDGSNLTFLQSYNVTNNGAEQTGDLVFTTAQKFDRFAIRMTRSGFAITTGINALLTNIEIINAPANETISLYAAHWKKIIFEDESLCEQKLIFKILDAADNSVKASSDEVLISDSGKGSYLIKYSNENKDYANLIYNDLLSYPAEFGIRVSGKFYFPRLQEENESEDTGDGTVDKLSSEVKEQRLFEFEPLPPYMIKKLKLILQHNTLVIENQLWVKEEAYETNQMNRSFGLMSSQVYLTLAKDVYINV